MAGLRALANMVKGHAAAYHAIHEIQPDAMVGVAHHWRGFKAANRGLLTAYVTKLHHKVFNDSFAYALKDGKFDAVRLKLDIPEAIGTQDFAGLNYYSRDLVKFDLTRSADAFARRYYPEGSDLSETGFWRMTLRVLWKLFVGSISLICRSISLKTAVMTAKTTSADVIYCSIYMLCGR